MNFTTMKMIQKVETDDASGAQRSSRQNGRDTPSSHALLQG